MKLFSIESFSRAVSAAIIASCIIMPNLGRADTASMKPAALRFDPATHPWPPRLTINARPKVCSRFLNKLTAIYASDAKMFDFGGKQQGPEERDYEMADQWGFRLVKWSEEIPDLDADNLGRTRLNIERDFDGDGKPEVLVVAVEPHGAYQKSGIFLFETREALENFTGELNLFEGTVASGWTAPVLLENGGSYFIFYPANNEFVLGLEPFRLLALSTDHKLVPVCEVRIFPYEQAAHWEIPKPDAAFGKGVRRLVSALTTSLGAPASCWVSSTMHTDIRNREHATSTMYTVLYRPWVPLSFHSVFTSPFDRKKPPATGPDALSYLRDHWRYWSLWNFRVYRDIEEALEPARLDLERAYAKKFGMKSAAAGFVKNRITALVSGFYTYVYDAPTSDSLTVALLTGQAHDHIDGDTVAIDGQVYTAEDFKYRLFAALEHPELVAFLIAQDADVNATNNFGKTPLMYAAQFDLIESAKLLLANGADPNRRTGQKSSVVCNAFDWTGRTALMYAAENASVDMIELLIENGADKDARDVKFHFGEKPDRGIADYLTRNPNLTDQETQTLIERWSIPAGSVAKDAPR